MVASIDPEVAEFIDDLLSELRSDELSMLDASFLAAVEAGGVALPQIGRWAAAFYASTRNGRLSIGNFYANSPDDPALRRELAENIYEEETGRLSGVGHCHMDVFRDFLDALGSRATDLTELATLHRVPDPHGRAIDADDFYVELAAYGLSVEAPNAEFCSRMFDALRTRYGLAAPALQWFSMHAQLDADHGDEFRK